MDTSSSTEQADLLETTRQKPGPKKGASKKLDRNLDELVTRLHNLEDLVTRIAHQAGISHGIIIGSGLTPFTPGRKDMQKRAG